MNRCKPGLGRLLGILLVLLMAMSCSHDDLPAVPGFEALGFEDALDVVRQQVHTVYEEWQDKPRDAGRNGRLGMHLSAYDKNATAEIFFRRARALALDDYRWSYYLANSLLEQGRLDEAAARYREVLKKHPGHLNSRLQLASLLLETSGTGESLKLYQQLTVEYPERIEGWLGLGKTLNRMGNNDAAAAALLRAWAIGPHFGEVHYALALVWRALGDEDEAARELAAYERTAHNKIRTYDPLLREINTLYAGDANHYAMAVYHYGQNDFQSAVNSFLATVRINPANVDAWAGLVSSQVKLDELEAAGETYREALAAEIAYARLHLTYGQALLDARQVDAARDVIGQAIELDPQYAEALSAMGELEMQSGDSIAAIAQFRRLLLVRPNDRRVQLSLAQALNAAGRFDEAAGLLGSLTTDPDVDRSLALKELALAYHGMDRKEDAIEALKRGREAVKETYNVVLEQTIERLLAEWQEEQAE